MSQVKQNIRLRFTKEGDVRFTSHHDLMRLFERAYRRAGLPVAMSEGHNPRPRISIPAPLGVSFRGLNEAVDFGLCEWINPQDFRTRFQAELPDGIRLTSATVTSTNPNRQPRDFSYRVPLLNGHSLTQRKADALLASEKAVVVRQRNNRPKPVNVCEFLAALRLEKDSLRMLISNSNRGTARPEEVLEALGAREGIDYRPGTIERTHVTLSSPSRT